MTKLCDWCGDYEATQVRPSEFGGEDQLCDECADEEHYWERSEEL